MDSTAASVFWIMWGANKALTFNEIGRKLAWSISESQLSAELKWLLDNELAYVTNKRYWTKPEYADRVRARSKITVIL